ncbi:F0F1 ATP synthase subunit B [Pisciglobus halotolerans]|uniref:ATP synthase subunit b n=1 Tax=Pisciglobus halotolerans TaxID=745365 RepID=A0A1I3C519_9LACT|nr:F0F1 ATP synthase subunit B [Pisciglobus halotolerans]SFH69632.1 ATP synthase F0 subcomplex B subunit [Pisciglobus halotolerans]
MMNLMLLGAVSSAGDTLFVLISFLILLLLLKKFAWQPLTAVMQERANRVASDIDNAEEAKKNANALVAEQQSRLKEAKNESSQIIDQARQASLKIEKEMMTESRAEVARMKEQAKDEIEVERQKTLANAKNEISLLSVQLAEQLIKKELTDKGHAQLIDDFIERLGDSNELK